MFRETGSYLSLGISHFLDSSDWQKVLDLPNFLASF